MILDTYLQTEISKCSVIELLSVVGNKHSGYLIPTDDIPLDKTSNVFLRDSG